MTKYILHGGSFRKGTEEQTASFCRELIKDIKIERPIKILICVFARPLEDWQVRYELIEKMLRSRIPNMTAEISKLEKFLEQMEEADTIFVEGGDTEQLKEIMSKYPGWEKKLEGKVYTGSSAGAQIISKYYHELDRERIAEGFGTLNIKVFVHWNSSYNPNIDEKKALEELKNYKENLPVYTIKEGEYVVFEK